MGILYTDCTPERGVSYGVSQERERGGSPITVFKMKDGQVVGEVEIDRSVVAAVIDMMDEFFKHPDW